MHLTDMVTLAHPLLHYGVPHPRQPDFRILPTGAHLIVFDCEKKAPAYAMASITPDTEIKEVERDDDFVPDVRLPLDLQTKSQDYRDWNKANSENKLDQGHLIPSQVRRADRSAQHHVDNLSGVIPETPALNRLVKSHLETDIVNFVREEAIDARYVAGPAYAPDKRIARLPSGQAIPHYSWISVLVQTSTKLTPFTYVMQNVWNKEEVGLESVCLMDFEALTGLVLWDQVDVKRGSAYELREIR